MNWLDLLSVQETLKSLLQQHGSKASIPHVPNILQVSSFLYSFCANCGVGREVTRQLLPGIVIPGAQAAAHLSLELEGCEVMGGVRWSGLRAALGS